MTSTRCDIQTMVIILVTPEKPTRGNYVSSPEKNVRRGGIISRVHEGLGCEINTIRILMRY